MKENIGKGAMQRIASFNFTYFSNIASKRAICMGIKMERKEITCISCPMGCLLSVAFEGDDIIVTGNMCKRGEVYGKNEVRDPRRMITTSIRIIDDNGGVHMLSVKTSNTVPKDRIKDCIQEIKKVNKKGSFFVGDVIIDNILGLNVDIIATREVP